MNKKEDFILIAEGISLSKAALFLSFHTVQNKQRGATNQIRFRFFPTHMSFDILAINRILEAIDKILATESRLEKKSSKNRKNHRYFGDVSKKKSIYRRNIEHAQHTRVKENNNKKIGKISLIYH